MTTLDTVTVSADTRHGRTRLHTFVRFVRGDNRAEWANYTPNSPKQRDEYGQQRREETANAVRGMTAAEQPLAIFVKPPPPRRPGDRYGEVLNFERIDLGQGLTPRGDTLVVVLDALHSAGRTGIDINDLKVVLSQLGSQITRLGSLTDEQMRHAAESALYAEILKRCTL